MAGRQARTQAGRRELRQTRREEDTREDRRIRESGKEENRSDRLAGRRKQQGRRVGDTQANDQAGRETGWSRRRRAWQPESGAWERIIILEKIAGGDCNSPTALVD